jgi:hypothetical protein
VKKIPKYSRPWPLTLRGKIIFPNFRGKMAIILFNILIRLKCYGSPLRADLGSSACTSMYYDLATLIQNVQLPILDNPFTMEEIQTARNDMPIEHAPGPDGFNGMFMKRCWSIIQEDFLRFFAQFCSGNLNIEPINGCYITLIPKKESPSCVNDYRPISLLNSSLKLLTKVLANILQSVILSVIHENQYGFIKGRSIKDCLAWAFQFMHLCL